MFISVSSLLPPFHFPKGFFTGSAVDVDLSWYLAIGVALSNTMFINAFTMQLPFLALELVAKRVLRYLQATGTKISQIHMNKMFAPSRFDVHLRMAMLMNTLIITFLFNTALPALVPFAAVAFALAFLVDKVRLCVASGRREMHGRFDI